MTAHELAKFLLTLPDLPVFMNGWGSDEGIDVEVVGATVMDDKIDLAHEEVKWP